MQKAIETKLRTVHNAINWVNSYLEGSRKKDAYSKLVNLRRNLNKIKYALSDNPGAAMYGESQVGKSYLAGALLSSENGHFNVVDQTGNSYDFIEEINPRGNEKESTSLVTRFSLNYSPINDDFPVKVKLLSVTEIVIILCDTYYNDLKTFEYLLESEIEEEIIELERSNINRPITQSILHEDDILDIQDYFSEHLKSKAPYLENSSFFDRISRIISKIEPAEWNQAFSLLWNKNKYISGIFNRLINQYSELHYANEVYVPFKAVLRKHGTLLDVERLKELNIENSGIENEYLSTIEVLIIDKNHQQTKLTFPKSYLCALASELIFKIPDALNDSKPFLKKTDLLDFPGSRARLENHERDLSDKLMPQMLLRGKVAFLFNKYSDNYKINTLLFCHGKKQASHNLLPEILNRWISSFIGDTPEARAKFIESSVISPLFVISTFFNVDLKYDRNDTLKNNDSLVSRWKQRFSDVLEREIFNARIYNWLNNWTPTQPFFQNIYMLRDFYFSSEKECQLFKGYIEHKKEIEEIIPADYTSFKNDLRNSFLNYDFVQNHFSNPEESWDRSASINEDGTELIIRNLYTSALYVNKAREEKLHQNFELLCDQLIQELNSHYNSDDSNTRLKKAKETAGNIQLKLDVSFGKDPYFFGNLIKTFTITEGSILNLYKKKLDSLELVQNTNLEKYSAIRLTTPGLSLTNDFDTNLQILCTKYEKDSLESCKNNLENEGIDLNELFYGNKNLIKHYSTTLVEELESYWFEECQNKFRASNLTNLIPESDFEDIIEMLKGLFKKLHLTEVITQRIKKYIDRYDSIDKVHEMIADISAEIINKFINTIGYAYFSQEDIDELKLANANNKLGLDFNHDYLYYENFSTVDVINLFDVLDNLPDLLNQNPIDFEILKNVPSFSNYKKWRDLLKFGFVSVCDIPNYDIKANESLGILIGECNSN